MAQSPPQKKNWPYACAPIHDFKKLSMVSTGSYSSTLICFMNYDTPKNIHVRISTSLKVCTRTGAVRKDRLDRVLQILAYNHWSSTRLHSQSIPIRHSDWLNDAESCQVGSKSVAYGYHIDQDHYHPSSIIHHHHIRLLNSCQTHRNAATKHKQWS